MCRRCNYTYFYDVRQSCKRESTDGVWMYMPRQNSGIETTSASKTSSDPGSPPDPQGPPSFDGSEAGGREGAESEIATTDPLVDPDASIGRRRRRRRGASNADMGPGSLQSVPKNEPNIEDRLINAIKNAVKPNQSEASWNSRKGPEKGVRFRGGTPPNPPLWKGSSADLRAFARWEKKVQVWMLQMKSYATDEDTALAFFTSLSGEAELEVEHLDLSQVQAKNGVQYVLDALREPLQQKQLFQKRRLLNEFESVARNNGESIRGYINRYNRVVRDLEAIGITTTGMYDSESRGYRLLERSRLAPDLQRLVLIAAGNSLQYEKITDALLLQFPDFKQPPAVFYHGSSTSAPSYHQSSKGSSKGSARSSSSSSSFTSSTQSSSGKSSSKGKYSGQHPKRVFQAEQVGSEQLPAIPETADGAEFEGQETEDFQDAEDGQDGAHDTAEHYDEAGEDLDEEAVMDLANVLTVTSKRLQATVLGRKFTGRPQSVEERKKVTACTACGAVGHWMGDPECPKSSKGKGSHKSFKGKSDGKGSSGSSSSNPKNSFVVSFPDSQNDHQEDFDTHEPYYTYMVGFPHMVKRSEDIHTTEQFSCHLTECLDLAGYIIIDTACQRTCCGVKWLNLHDQLLRSRNLSSKTISVNDHFQFGAGGVQLANQRAYIPIGLPGTKQQGLLFGAGVLELSLPLLASNSLLDMLGSVINLVDMKLHATKLGVDIPILKKHNHLVCNILDFPSGVHLDSCWEKLEHPSFWKSPHPELIVAPGVILDQKSTVQVSIRSTSADALNITSSIASGMASGMENYVDQADDPSNEVLPLDVQDGEVQHSTKDVAVVGRVPGRSTVASRDCIESSDPPTAVHTSDSSSVRKSSWPIRSVQSMWSEVPVERKPTRLGNISTKVAALACLAAAIFGNHGSSTDSGWNSSEEQSKEFSGIFTDIATSISTASPGSGDTRDLSALHGGGDRTEARWDAPLHARGVGRDVRSGSLSTGLGRSRPRKPLAIQSPGVRLGSVEDQWEFQDGMLIRHHRMPRTELFLPDQDQCPIQISRLLPFCNAKMKFENSSHQELQYNWCEMQETEYKETMPPWTGCTVFKISKAPAKPGLKHSTRRRLRGRLLQTAHVFAVEVSVMENRPQKLKTRVDILETFAGQGNISKRCVHFGLKSLAPIDYETGWNLYRKEDQQHVDRALEQYQPLFLMQGLDCKDWCLLQDNVNLHLQIGAAMAKTCKSTTPGQSCSWMV